MSLNTTPRTWVAGEVVTAAELNAEVRDAITGIQAAWTTYTPAWTSSGTAPAIGNGTIVGHYIQVGKTVTFWLSITAGSTTTFGTGNYRFGLPVSATASYPSTGNYPIGLGSYWDSSAVAGGQRRAILAAGTTNSVLLSDDTGAVITATTVAWATGDVFYVTGSYEAA